MRHLASLGLLAVTTGCGTPVCSEDVLQVARDPGSDRYASTVVRNCGATTGFVTVVKVGRSSERQSDADEVFVADSDHGAASVGDGGALWINVVWPRPGQLGITFASGARTFKTVRAAKGAAITFRRSDPFSAMPPA